MATLRTVYVNRKGATIRCSGQHLRVCEKGKKPEDLRLLDVGQLVFMGNIMISPSALDLIVKRGIDAVFLSHHGRYRGRIESGVSSNIRLRIRQYRSFCDDAQALALARIVVAGKIHNQRMILSRHARRYRSNEAFHPSIVALRASLMRLESVTNLDQLRGVEGAAAAAYFRGFSHMIRAEGFHFNGRNRRPPIDPINALLSFGYTLLSTVVEGAVRVVGLDAYLGTLHEPTVGRASLVCDLVEEFRAPVVDALVVAAINQKAFQVSDFEDSGDGAPVVIKREAVRWLLTLFERRMASATRYAPQDRRLSLREIILQQARAMARHVMGTETYTCYAPR